MIFETSASRTSSTDPGTFIVSLDLELYWGARDHLTYDCWTERMEHARNAVPNLLDLFDEFDIHATWAVVGMLLSADRQDLLRKIPRNRPRYRASYLSPYRHVGVIGSEESSDGTHYARSLVSLIARTPHQEVASHTFSHYYCLEKGQTRATFEEDVRAAVWAHEEFLGSALRTIVFPRNQVNPDYFDVLRKFGVQAYRGTPGSWLYRPTKRVRYGLIRRALRYMDSFVPLSGDNLFERRAPKEGLMNVPASLFLRPYSRKLALLAPLKLSRIKRSIDRAAASGAMYHLWWHPENFWSNANENFGTLRQILKHVTELRASGLLVSLNMAEVVDMANGSPADSGLRVHNGKPTGIAH